MSETSFSQVNTAISVQEASFLTPQQYDQLLQADDPASRSALLQGTVYSMDSEAIKDLNAIEQVLMKHLYSVYNWALEISPSKELVEIFCGCASVTVEQKYKSQLVVYSQDHPTPVVVKIGEVSTICAERRLIEVG